jgi:8-oxo-dGTP pyrophosphatase MutT (NUDIX family)
MSGVLPITPDDVPGPHSNRRPRDAATLIVLRRDPDGMRVLMGRRSDRHVFMPGKVVFPGGGVDAADRHAPSADELDPAVEAKLLSGMRGRPSRSRARALALAAIREAFEETGVVIGRPGAPTRPAPDATWRRFHALGLLPSLSPLRLIARAVTPPRRPRRFDARFFAVFGEHIARCIAVPEDELMSPEWLTFEETGNQDLPAITRAVLADLQMRLTRDPELSPDAPVPFHYMRSGQVRRETL